MGIANSVTGIRIVLAPVVAILLFLPHVPYNLVWSAALFVVAIITDLIDGRLARAYGESGPVGGHLDGLADKLLWNLLLFAFVFVGIVPFWFAAVTFTRDALATEFKSLAALRNVKMAVTSFEGKAKVLLQNIGIGFGFAGMLGLHYGWLTVAHSSMALNIALICFVVALAFGLINFSKDLSRNFRKVFA
ncbi:MAG TPA: CDP-alcohol phosphatidyltransferase family protein [Candidatus Peribacteria bacterium]|nr:CDP-alcohol phosphatidyltransferase family protein [Candidatus Peribacteria bacterium]